MKYTEIKDLNLPEIQKRLVQNKQNLFDIRIKHKMQRQSNPLQIRFLKRDISRLQTVLSSLPESAFQVPREKVILKVDKKESRAVKPSKSQLTKTVSKKTIEKPVEKKQKAVTAKKEKKEQEKPVKQKRWFGFMGLKSKQDKNLKAVSKKSFFRRKSG